MDTAALQQRSDSDLFTNASRLMVNALEPSANYAQVTRALEALLALTRQGLAGDAQAYAHYQSALLQLHLPGDPRTWGGTVAVTF